MQKNHGDTMRVAAFFNIKQVAVTGFEPGSLYRGYWRKQGFAFVLRSHLSYL